MEPVPRRSKLTLVAGIVAIASGAAIVIGTIATKSFSRADAGQAATDLVRPEMTPDGLAQHRADFEIATAAVEELYAEAFPVLAAEVSLTPEEFEQQIEANYPAVGEFISSERREEAYAFAEAIVANLERHQEDFEEADAIPVSWMTMDVGPWLAVALGAVLALAGVIAVLRPSRLALAIVAVLGLALVVGPLVTRFPQKAYATRDLLDSLTFSTELAAETRALGDAANAATEELNQELLPDIATALGLTQTELDERIAESFPAIARAGPQFDEIFQRYDARIRIREEGTDVIPIAAAYPLTEIGWFAIGLGALTAVPAIAALVARSRSRTGTT